MALTLTVLEFGTERTVEASPSDTVGDVLLSSPETKRSLVMLNGEVVERDASLSSLGLSPDRPEYSPTLEVTRRRRRLEPADPNRLQQWSMLSPAARDFVRGLHVWFGYNVPEPVAPEPEPMEAIEFVDATGLEKGTRTSEEEVLAMDVEMEVLPESVPGDCARVREILLELQRDPHAWDVSRHQHNLTKMLLVEMFEDLDLLAPFNVSRPQFESFIEDLCEHYSYIPFHSFTHAVDVTAATFVGLRHNNGGAQRLRPLAQFAVLLAAAGHDIGHTGTTNAHQKEASTPIYAEFGAVAPLEKMHTQLALSLIEKHKLLDGLSAKDAATVRELIKFAVLGTDIAAHSSIMSEWSAIAPSVGPGSWSTAANVCDFFAGPEHQLVRMILKCSDLGCCTRDFAIGRHWADCLVRECEAQALLPNGNDGGMNTATISKCQKGFVGVIVVPMFEAMAEALPEYQDVMENVKENGRLWSELAAAQAMEA